MAYKFLGNLIGLAALLLIIIHVNHQTDLNDTTRRHYGSLLFLNFLFCVAGHFIYNYALNGYTPTAVAPNNTIGLVATKYFIGSLASLVLFAVVTALNYMLMTQYNIPKPKQRALTLAFVCVTCFLASAIYGSYAFYSKHM